ncbi:putative transcriptional regulator, AsnC family protein [Pilimelia terevasa]|uniref:Putative transcriptional regulator, AsnC family protein n=2 Tax=Pilimelia terevasa TaxID=53372 RepID=A0A8J3FDM2_9ACTN|nr:putative transcriptional regulator, AsnC family protein [Pilimelia terevasa]
MPNTLDPVDRHLVRLLSQDARTSNAALAAAVGIAPSTCLARVRGLRERGIIRGYHADIDPAALGRPLQALIAVRLANHARDQVAQFRTRAPRLPGVIAVYHVTGPTDYLLHVTVADAGALRDFVTDALLAEPYVAHAETSLIFEYQRGTPPL